MLLKFCRSSGQFANQEMSDGLDRMNPTGLAAGYEVVERTGAWWTNLFDMMGIGLHALL